MFVIRTDHPQLGPRWVATFSTMCDMTTTDARRAQKFAHIGVADFECIKRGARDPHTDWRVVWRLKRE